MEEQRNKCAVVSDQISLEKEMTATPQSTGNYRSMAVNDSATIDDLTGNSWSITHITELNRDFPQADYYIEGRLSNQAESSLGKRFLVHSALKSGASNIF